MINESKKYLNCDVVTKYRLMDYYNANCVQLVKASRKYRIKYSDNWCAMFTSVIAHKCGLTANQFPYEVSVMEQVKIAESKGTFTKNINDVKTNDLIIYNWDNNGTLDHVGFVIEVSDGTVKAIEGNIRNTVGYRTLPINSKSIHGYIKTNYKNNVAIDEKERIANLAQATIAGKFGNGLERQRNLGNDYKAVQNYINVMYK